MLPKKLNSESKINLVHTSSPVSKADMKSLNKVVDFLKKDHTNTAVFDVERTNLDPRYLAASENERLKKFRQAIRQVDWLAPVYGGTGCGDIIRYLSKEDLNFLRRNRPIVNGFSDTTFLLNYLYFKLKLNSFHFSNACGLLGHSNYKQFMDIISGKVEEYSYKRPGYSWLSPNEGPKEPIEGIAIGGNFSTFRDMLDICDIKPRSWEDYILFIEDVELDMEDLHRVIIALDERGVFMHVKALVLGGMDEKGFDSAWNKLNGMFGDKKKVDHMFEYLISDVIEERTEQRDPLYILKVDNLGHGIYKDHMILPIGAKTIIEPDKTIKFVGPFVE